MRAGAAAAALAILTTGCVTPQPVDRPEFAQRAAPRPGQDEIELLAGFNGTLAIQDGCLGLETRYDGRAAFSTLVWPANARLEQVGGRWQVRNTRSGAVVRTGEYLRGGGGGLSFSSADDLARFNHYLTRKLSPRCAAKGALTINHDFPLP